LQNIQPGMLVARGRGGFVTVSAVRRPSERVRLPLDEGHELRHDFQNDYYVCRP
jgi:hypothetical protein